MAATFALHLDNQGVSLYRQGEPAAAAFAALDAPDFDARIAAMREIVADAAGDGRAPVRLVLPDSQILYTEARPSGLDRTADAARVRTALEGATPYDLSELVYDWREDSGMLRVAVIARETLDEARGFAAAHGFTTTDCVGAAGEGAFPGQPRFRMQPGAADATPLDTAAEPGPDATAPEPPATAQDAPPESPSPDRDARIGDETGAGTDSPEKTAPESPEPTVPAPQHRAKEHHADAAGTTDTAARGQTAASAPGRLSPHAAPSARPEVTFTTIRRSDTAPETAPDAAAGPDEDAGAPVGRAADDGPDAPVAETAPAAGKRPRVSLLEAGPEADASAASLAPEPALETGARRKDARGPSPLARLAGSARGMLRRSGKAPPAPEHAALAPAPPLRAPGGRGAPGPERSAAPAALPRQRQAQAVPGPKTPAAPSAPRPAAPSAPRPAAPSAARPAAPSAPRPAAPPIRRIERTSTDTLPPPPAPAPSEAATVDEAASLTVFGARRMRDEAPRGGARRLGLTLTVGLIALMGLVALWSLWVDGAEAPDTRAEAPTSPPAITQALPTPAPDTPDAPASERAAALPPLTADDQPGAGTGPDTVAQPPTAPTAERAADSAADAPAPATPRPQSRPPRDLAGASPADPAPEEGDGATPSEIAEAGALPDAEAQQAAPADSAAADGTPPGASVDAPSAPPADDGTEIAALRPGPAETPGAAAPAPQAAPATSQAPAPLDPAEAEAAYAVTGIWQRAPERGGAPSTARRPGITMAAIEPAAPLAPPRPPAPVGHGSAPALPPLPLPPGTRLDAEGFVIPTPEGALAPGGYRVIEGRPEIVPPPRPDPDAPPPAAPAESADAPLEAPEFRPVPRPGDEAPEATPDLSGDPGAQQTPPRPLSRPGIRAADPEEDADPDEDAALQADDATAPGQTDAQQTATAGPDAVAPGPRPLSRPDALVAEATRAAEEAERAARVAGEEAAAAARAIAEAEAEAQAAFADASPLAVARAPDPRARPASLAQQAAQARAAQARAAQARAAQADAPAPEQATPPVQAAAAAAAAPATRQSSGPAVARSQRVRPDVASSALVARQATERNALRMNRVTLIGVYGSASQRRALVRLPSGRYVKVKVGDRLDGGQVAAIDRTAVRYVKSGRSVVIEMPSG